MQRIKSKLFFSLYAVVFLFLFPNESFGQNLHNKKTFNIVDYGAVPNEKTLNTRAIQKAIDAANKMGAEK